MAGLARRSFLRLALASALGLVAGWSRRLHAADEAPRPLSAAALEALPDSPFVYVSPIKRDGSESRCHAEVWYAWLDGTVVMTVASERWKATAIRRGLERARIWVGDEGRLKGLNARSQAFRKAPSFEVRGALLQDAALLERLLTEYGRKYPEEIGAWRDKMRAGHADGSRVLIRYTPV